MTNDSDMEKAMNDTIAFFASAGVENAKRRQRQAAYGRARAYAKRKRGAGGKRNVTPTRRGCEPHPDEGFLGEVKKIPLAKASEVLKADMMKAASTHTAQPPQGKRLAVKDTTPFWNDHHDGLDGIRHGVLEVCEGLGYDKRAMNARARRHQREVVNNGR